MNKYLILLGLVLLASLSFAADGPSNWMQSVEGRYSCMYDYNYWQLELIGPGCEIIGEDEYFDIIDTYFECEGCMIDNLGMMMSSAGCSRAPTNPALFRSQMGAFNANNLAFRQIFLSKIRGCIAGTLRCDCGGEGTNREFILAEMREFNADYRSCLIGEEEPPYCREPEEGGEEDS